MKNKLFKLSLYIYKLGLVNGLNTVAKMFLGKKGKEIKLKISGIKFPVIIRAQTSDEYTFQQIFVEKQYNFQYEGSPEIILDGGANIGLASIYFANRFPGSRIFSIEPEKRNFEILQKNIQQYSNITAIPKGLWGKNTFLKVNDTGLDNWGFTVEECDQTIPDSLHAISIPGLMQEYDLKQIDLIKLDIEGSEKNILENNNTNQWLPNCKTLVIELHDRMISGTSETFFKTMLKYSPFQTEIKGENIVCHFKH